MIDRKITTRTYEGIGGEERVEEGQGLEGRDMVVGRESIGEELGEQLDDQTSRPFYRMD
jgi:hypothetical protein